MIGIILFFIILFFVFNALISTLVGCLIVIQGAIYLTLAQILRFIVVILDLIEKYWPKKRHAKPLPSGI